MALPRPKVEVSKPADSDGATGTGNARQIVISRDNKARSYVNDGSTPEEAIAKGIEQILDDPRTREWLP